MVDPRYYEYNIETDYKSVRNFTTLEWTTAPPTQEGLYKAQGKDGIMYWAELRDGWVKVMGDERESRPDRFVYWLGPLPEPEPPTEGG